MFIDISVVLPKLHPDKIHCDVSSILDTAYSIAHMEPERLTRMNRYNI